LFWVQLLTAKMILPVLGGSASVWNTCMKWTPDLGPVD
jgi:hypothetical protein